MKRTGIVQPGIKIENNDLFCGKCRFLSKTNYPLCVDVKCQLFDKLIISSRVFKETDDPPRLQECLTCEVLHSKETGYVPYKRE